MKKYSRTKIAQKQGFRTPDFIREKFARPVKPAAKFNPITFKTQHKG